MAKVAASILSSDFANLERDIGRAASCGADLIHIDVMDGVFVPNITVGIPVVEAIRRVTDLPLDVHLMIDRPIRYAEQFCLAGADILTIHAEADTAENNLEALRKIRKMGVRTGVSLKPATPPNALDPYMDFMDSVLVMTVEPGFGGQKFMEDVIPKLRTLRKIMDLRMPGTDLEVDGGITLETGKLCTEAGANVLAAGSALFHAPDMASFIQDLHRLV